MKDWNEAPPYSLSLPGVAMGSDWGTPCPDRHCQALPGQEASAPMSPYAEQEMQFEPDPDTFWQTDQRHQRHVAKKPQRVAARLPERP